MRRRRLVAACVVLATSSVRAWGPLGHRIVAETAALLVQDDLPGSWGPLLARQRFDLGVYSFYPDSAFRHMDGAGGKLEAPTHYLNLDLREQGPDRGSVDRRIDQLLGLARERLAGVRKPPGGYRRGATDDGDAGRIFSGLYLLGLTAHYSGDAAMPYHATSDFNGYATGQGGIHYYFENDCVNAMEPGLAADVLASARKHRLPPTADPDALVQATLRSSAKAVPAVAALDRAHAVVALNPQGSRATARRRPPAEGCRAMRRILVSRLAEGAALSAALWESALPRDVDFSDASDLQFSDMVVAPDYIAPR